MKWRFIDLEVGDAFYNMAVDQVIAEFVSKGESLPTIRFYKWKPAAVSISSYQKESDINLDLCKKLGIDCVRRVTGGRAVYHNSSDFTYSVVMPVNYLDVNKSYKKVCRWIINSLKYLGISSELRNKNDIIVNDKKISGNAAKVLDKKVFLQHGTLVYDLDADLTAELLRIDDKNLIRGKVTSVLEQAKVNEDEVLAALKKSFLKNKRYEIGGLSDKEKKRVEEVIKECKSLEKNGKTENRGACYTIWGDN